MFLRADKFDVQEAARRMEKYWGDRLRLFGDEVAFQPRPILLTDLSDQDLATLRNTGLQLLPKRDKAGRALILHTRRKWLFEDPKDIGRLKWYLFHVALEDVGVQRNGIILLMYDDGPFELSHFDRKLDKLCLELLTKSLPVRPIAVHHFFNNKVIDFLLPFLLFMMGRELRLRYTHYRLESYGDDRFLGKLEEFGILPAMLPTWVKGGTMEFDAEQWLEERRREELRSS